MNRLLSPGIVFFITAITCLPLVAEENIIIVGLFKDRVVFKLHDKQYSLTPGETINDTITLVSADSKEAVFDINGSHYIYTLGGHIGSRFNQQAPGTIVTIAPDRNGMYWVNGSINRHQTEFIVDTGATMISMNKHAAARFGIDFKLIGKQALSNTAAGPDTIYIVTLKSVNVGDIQLTNVTAAVHDSDYPDAILLGNSFLNNVSIKREGKLLQLIK
jgi:aspartyl protease family protein